MLPLPLLLLVLLPLGTLTASLSIDFQSTPNQTLAREYWHEWELVQNQQNEINLFPSDHQESAPSDLHLPPIPPQLLMELKWMAGWAAASYCAKDRVFPRWQCGFPRCSSRKDGSSSSSLYHNDDDDILAATEPISYFNTKKTRMVGMVTVNPRLNSHALHPLSNQPPIPSDIQSTWRIVIVFRGSLHPVNFLYDLRAAQPPLQYPGAPNQTRIHLGFWETWQDVKEHVIDGVRKAVDRWRESTRVQGGFKDTGGGDTGGKKSTKPVHVEIMVSGHSLGGAVGLLCALTLRKMAMFQDAALGLTPCRRENQWCGRLTRDQLQREQDQGVFRFMEGVVTFRVYTFGQPRVGNEVFADWVMQIAGFPIYRTTYYDDLIPHLPPVRLGEWSFRHHTSEFHIRRWASETVACDDTPTMHPSHPDSDSPLVFQGNGGGRQESKGNVEPEGPTERRGEDPSCSRGVRFLNPISHLTYWDILFGPWC